ncbi:MAG: hypothetical protein KAG82_09545 [Alcanivoracaceae bacterium]|nr:hypothetical protein [Alcanivoracaceae bacterium]
MLAFFFIIASVASAALREDNITDQEVREIQTQVERYFPGIIVMIDGVQAPCDCREGAGCTAQVNVAAVSGQEPVLMRLSRIDGEWVPGVVWQWQQELRRLIQQLSANEDGNTNGEERRRAADRMLAEHRNRVPVCAPEGAYNDKGD